MTLWSLRPLSSLICSKPKGPERAGPRAGLEPATAVISLASATLTAVGGVGPSRSC
jgi:hypothetical protein